jgi:hypothetical protein
MCTCLHAHIEKQKQQQAKPAMSSPGKDNDEQKVI